MSSGSAFGGAAGNRAKYRSGYRRFRIGVNRDSIGIVPTMVIQVTTATGADAAELADVAARTFPLACPPSSTAENIAAFVTVGLGADRFAEYVRGNKVLAARARQAGPILGYAMLIEGIDDDPDVQRAVTLRPAIQLSKMYVLPEFHGATVSSALMTAAISEAVKGGAAGMWLGVNQQNERAQRFYIKHGFSRCGTKTFRVGEVVEDDYVMQRPVAAPQ